MSAEKFVIDDLVVLGNAVPDFLRDSRVSVCTAGYSPKHGLVRVYPVPPKSAMQNRWNIVEVPVERRPEDKRIESWKIQGSKSEWERLSSKIKLVGKVPEGQRGTLMDKLFGRFGVGCVETLSEKQLSLGLIRPSVLGYKLTNREDYEPAVQLQLGSVRRFLTIKNYKKKPMIRYRCGSCKTKSPHNQQVVEWGVYNWMRRFPDKEEQVWENLGLTRTNDERMFLVGNMFLHPNSFIIISLFHRKFDPQQTRILDYASN